jgi:hypothetical protein
MNQKKVIKEMSPLPYTVVHYRGLKFREELLGQRSRTKQYVHVEVETARKEEINKDLQEFQIQ